MTTTGSHAVKGPSYRSLVTEGLLAFCGNRKQVLVSRRRLSDFVKAGLGPERTMRLSNFKKTLASLEEEQVIVRIRISYHFYKVRALQGVVRDPPQVHGE